MINHTVKGCVKARSRGVCRELNPMTNFWNSAPFPPGQLTEEELKKLKRHFAVCKSCREALRQCQMVVDEAIPAIGAQQQQEIDPGPGWSKETAEKAFFQSWRGRRDFVRSGHKKSTNFLDQPRMAEGGSKIAVPDFENGMSASSLIEDSSPGPSSRDCLTTLMQVLFKISTGVGIAHRECATARTPCQPSLVRSRLPFRHCRSSRKLIRRSLLNAFQ
jgi:hypothetical protein